MRVAFIGFGEASRAFRESLAPREPGISFACYDLLFEGETPDGPTARAARAAGVEVARTAAEAVAGADWVVSAVTADASVEAARAAADGIGAGQKFFDINSVSPGRKRAAAGVIVGRGGVYVDMAVMGPVHPRGHRTPALLGGSVGADVIEKLRDLDFRIEVVGPEVGSAAAVKLVRSVFVKGLEAVTVEALLAAEAAGCLERVVRSLSASFQGLGWPDFAAYELERSLRHGTRRGAEMRESGRMLDELGLDGGLARAVADVQERMGALGEAPESPRFAELIARVEAACRR